MRISQLPDAGPLLGDERVLLNQRGETKTTAVKNIKGSAGGIQVINVRDFGAVGDGVTDDWAAIQAALDTVAASGPGTVYVPPTGRSYMVSRPLRIKTTGVRLTGGVSGDASFPRPPAIENMWLTAGNFPTIHCFPAQADAAPNWSIAPSLVPGPGGALSLSNATGHQDAYVNWCEAPVYLNGLTQFTVECFVRRTSTAGGNLVCSSGSLFLGTQDTAFQVYVPDALAGSLTTTTGVYQISGTTPLTVGVVYHVEMSWDGQTLRLFVNGVLDASVPATGTMVQKPHEFGSFGHEHITWAGGVVTFGIEGQIDSIRLSKVARHTAGFKPPATKLTFDQDALLLQNFDDDDNLWTRCMTAGVPGQQNLSTWLPKYGRNDFFITNLEIDHLMLIPHQTGQGIWARECPTSSFHDLFILGGVIGFNSARNQFTSSFKRLTLLSENTGRVGFLGGVANGVCSWEDVFVAAYSYGFVVSNSSGTLTNFFLNGNSVIPIVLMSGTYDVRGVICSNEDVTPGFPQLATMALIGNDNVVMSGCVFETLAGPKPAVMIDGGRSATMIGVTVNTHPDAKELIQFKSPLAEQELRLIAPSRMHPNDTPWSLSPVVQV